MSTGDNVQGILGAIGPFLGKLGLARVPRSASFLCGNPDDLLGTSQRSIFTKFGHETYLGIPSMNPERHFSTIFTLGVIFLQNLKSKIGQNRHLTQSRLQVTGCTAEIYCLLHVVVQRAGSFRVRSTFLQDVQLRSYGASKLPNFRILANFPHTKPLKRTVR